MKLESNSQILPPNANKLKVFCRMRMPPNDAAYSQYKINSTNNTIELENKTTYSFNKIFVDSSQQEIYDFIILPSLNEAMLNSFFEKLKKKLI